MGRAPSGDQELPRRRYLVNRLLVVTVLAGLAAGLVGALLLQRAARGAALAEAQDRTRLVATQYAVRLESSVQSQLGALRLAATRRELASRGAAAADELRVVLRASQAFDELLLLDADGAPVAAAASRFFAEADDYRPRPDLLASIVAGDRVSVVRGDPVMVELAVPVEDPPGQVAGALVGRARLEDVAAALQEPLVAGDPVPFLVTPTGDVLAHRDRRRVLAATPFPLATLEASGGQITLDVGGRRQLVAGAPVEALGATVVVEQPEESALAPVEDRRNELLVILLAVLVATVLAVALAGELLLRPLRPLTATVVRVGRRERGVRTGLSGAGEIGVLAAEVDRMAESLDRRDEQIAELRDLSLLVGSLVERRELARRVAEGATKLVRADGAAVLPPPGPDDRVALAAAGSVDLRRPPDGRTFEVELAGSDKELLGVLVAQRRELPFDDDERDVLRAFGAFAAIALDNARRLALQHELVEQLQQAVDRRRDLIGTITHEFRTPLACIEGFTTTLLDGWGDYSEAERRELVGRIGRHGEELDELVSRFLDFTVSERGGMSAKITTMRLGEAIEQTVATLAPLLADRRITVDVADVFVAADHVLLRRTLTNLLSNAVKYSASGSQVQVRATVDGDVARVEVVDEGAGMAPDEAQRAFDAFWRGGSATTRSTRGAGLGLALVTEYLRVMGGTASVDTAPGRGSTFSFTLPVATIPPASELGAVDG